MRVRQRERALSSQRMRWREEYEREEGWGKERDREREAGLPQGGPSQEKLGFNHGLEKRPTLSESLSPHLYGGDKIHCPE